MIFSFVTIFSESTESDKILLQVINRTIFTSTDNDDAFGMYINRSHFGYQHKFDDKFSGVIILDAGRPTIFGNTQIIDSLYKSQDQLTNYKEGSYYSITLKFSYLEFNPNENIKLQLGGILQNHYITQEKFWGYRYIAETFQDKYLASPSGDLGIISYFNLYKKTSFDLALTNGEGFRFNQDNTNNVKLAGGLNYEIIKGLSTRIYFDYFIPRNNQKQYLYSMFIAYKHDDLFRIGLEYIKENNFKFIENANISGISLFATYILKSNFEIFARFDNVETENYIKTDKFNNLNGKDLMYGIHYSPTQGISLGLSEELWFDSNFENKNKNIISFSFEYKVI